MQLIDREIKCDGRADVFEFYPLGDLHIGSRSCAEKPLRKMVAQIAASRNALWIGGGDYLEAVLPQDIKRFDMDTLPDWILEGDAKTIRKKLNSILAQQYDRARKILEPIKHKCLGLIEGNHEYQIRKRYNENVVSSLCGRLETPELTDEAVIRLRFKRNTATATVIIYICHGWGGGRTAGAEPTKLHRMRDEWEIADICLRGHSHIFDIIPPKPILEIPRTKSLPKELTQRYRWAANWGCWVYSHASGPSSYASRACYPARPMQTTKIEIKPFANTTINGRKVDQAHIEVRGITL